MKNYYLTNKTLLPAVIKAKQEGKLTNELAGMLMLLVERYATHPRFAFYTYNDDMQGYALMMLVKTWVSFNPEKSNNPFSYYTTSIKNSFFQFINNEYKQSDTKDEMLIQNGLNPSSRFGERKDSDSENATSHDDEQDFDVVLKEAKKLERYTKQPIMRDEFGEEIIDEELLDELLETEDIPKTETDDE